MLIFLFTQTDNSTLFYISVNTVTLFVSAAPVVQKYQKITWHDYIYPFNGSIQWGFEPENLKKSFPAL
jgi:hypothetical protein